jgi:hypothetical protein
VLLVIAVVFASADGTAKTAEPNIKAAASNFFMITFSSLPNLPVRNMPLPRH